jgi:hypothetical protein
MDWNGVEKRRFVRANFPCKISILSKHQHIIETHTENIGAGGIRVIIEERLDIGSTVGLKIYLEKEKPSACKGKIVWVVEKESNYRTGFFLYDTGVEFFDMKKTDTQLIDSFVEKIVFGEK